MNIQLETVNCPLCGSDKQNPYVKAPDRFDLDQGSEFQIGACSGCGFVFLNPRPTAELISRFYESDGYDPFSSAQSKADLWTKIYRRVRTYTVRSKRQKIERIKSCGKILDIGCGTGEFLHEMKSHRWEVVGIETDPQAANFSQNEYAIKVHNSEVDSCDFAKKIFDVITLWHVLEHLFNPLETLKSIRKFLKDDGVVLVAAPNISSFDSRFYKSNWVALDAPRHLMHFTPASMNAFAEAAGMKVIRCQPMPLDAFYNCLMSEQLIRARGAKMGLPFYLLRALVIAKLSVFISSPLINRKSGSSVLYFMQKSEE